MCITPELKQSCLKEDIKVLCGVTAKQILIFVADNTFNFDNQMRINLVKNNKKKLIPEINGKL